VAKLSKEIDSLTREIHARLQKSAD